MLATNIVDELKIVFEYQRAPLSRIIKKGMSNQKYWNTCHCGIGHNYRYEIECDWCFNSEDYEWMLDGFVKTKIVKKNCIKPSYYLKHKKLLRIIN